MASPGYQQQSTTSASVTMPADYNHHAGRSGGMPISGILTSTSETVHQVHHQQGEGEETGMIVDNAEPSKPVSNLDILAQSIPQSPPRHSRQASPDRILSTTSMRHSPPEDSGKRSREHSTEAHHHHAEDDEDPALQSYRKRKRLSINTSLSSDPLVARHAAAVAGGPGGPSSVSSSGKDTSTGGSGGGFAAGSASATPVSREVYEKTLMVKQQQKALIEARNLKSAKNQQPYVPPTSAAPTPNEAVNATPVTASSAEFKAASIPARRNSLRNLKIMTPHAAAENHAQRAGHEGSAATAPPGPAPPSLPGTAMNGGAPATAGYAHPTSHISHPQPPPTATPPSHSHHPQLSSPRFSHPSGPGKSLPPRYTPVVPNTIPPSPRNEFPSRDLPLPNNSTSSTSSSTSSSSQYDPSAPPPRSPHPLFATDRSKAHLHQPSTSHPKSPNSAYPTSAHPGFSSTPFSTISKSNFMGAFEGLYDAAEELPRLSGTLREQIRRSSSLLQTLQASGAMIEGLVRGLFREMQAQYGEKFGAALADLNRRLAVVEEMNGVPVGTSTAGGGALQEGHHGFRGLGPPTPYVVGSKVGGFASNDIILKSLMERIEALEKKTEP